LATLTEETRMQNRSLSATVSLLAALLPLATADDARSADALPTAGHYSLLYEIFPAEGRLTAHAEVSVANETATEVREVPFLLYRLFDVDSVTGPGGAPLVFATDIVRDADTPQLHVNRVDVTLPEPLDPGKSTQVAIDFSGPLHGYSEVWGYVRDTISEEYTLLRDDTLAYPILALPMRASRFADRRFTYDLEVTVPEGYIVASGGRVAGARTAGGRTTFSYVSKVPVWRFDVAAARFSVRRSDDGALAVFVLPGHENGADRVLEAMRDAVDLFTDLFGSAGDFQGYTAIEIPEGWGSQAADLYFLQTAAAFEKPDRILEVYHEVGHNWNAKPRPDVQRCRYFDEAFASYFQALALRAFEGDQAWLDDMEHSRQVFVRWTERDPAYPETPIVDYGKHEFGHLSYSKGAWSLYVLHRLVGEESFQEIVRRLLAEASAVGFDDFERIATEVSGRDLDQFFAEWLRGTESSRLLVENVPIDEILARYK
jgi:hypothetical protein